VCQWYRVAYPKTPKQSERETHKSVKTNFSRSTVRPSPPMPCHSPPPVPSPLSPGCPVRVHTPPRVLPPPPRQTRHQTPTNRARHRSACQPVALATKKGALVVVLYPMRQPSLLRTKAAVLLRRAGSVPVAPTGGTRRWRCIREASGALRRLRGRVSWGTRAE
jgi:hypothetical protein